MTEHTTSPALQRVSTPEAPTPRGHYSQAVIAQGFVHVAGLLPGHPADGRIATDSAAQAEQVLANLDAVLRAAGSDRSRVVSLQVFLCDNAMWPVFNAACAAYFGDHRPARTAVPILALRDGALLEINAVALA